MKPVQLIQQNAKVILTYYTLCYFQYFLQSILELLLILFITKNHNEKHVSKYGYVYQRKNY